MLAMQYRFVLPADYDMSIIRRRIAERAHRTDGLRGLRFKAYLSADRGMPNVPTRENLYVPFYLWADNEGMNAFLCGDGFAGVSDAFGRPSVATWSVWGAELSAALASARFASSLREPVPPHAVLAEWRLREIERNARDRADGALAAVSAFEPTTWSLVRFRLWSETRPDLARDGAQIYAVGHVSTGPSPTTD